MRIFRKFTQYVHFPDHSDQPNTVGATNQVRMIPRMENNGNSYSLRKQVPNGINPVLPARLKSAPVNHYSGHGPLLQISGNIHP